MPKLEKLRGGSVIGALGLALIFWSLPIVAYTLFAELNPNSAAAASLAMKWNGKNAAIVISLFLLLNAMAMFFDRLQARKGADTLRNALTFGLSVSIMAWIGPLTYGEREGSWIVEGVYASLLMLAVVVCTRLIRFEAEKLEGNAGRP